MLRAGVSLAAVAVLAVIAFWNYNNGWGVLLATALGVAATAAWQFSKDVVQAGRNSIGGDYDTLTTGSSVRDPTEKEVEGKIARSLHLDQRGKRVTGVETGGSNKWSLDGKVSGEFVFGTWEQIEPPSSLSKGAFHLTRDTENRFHFVGQWIGWVPVKGAEGSGKWDWTRRPR
jgi:hypothetical protein